MLDRYQTLLDTSCNFLEDRPLMKEHNHASLAIILRMLADEVEEAIETAELGDEDFEVHDKAVEQELADIGIFLMTAFEIVGSDMFGAMMEKYARNMLKYPAYLFQDTEDDYSDKAIEAKMLWAEGGGKDMFYNGNAKQFIRSDEKIIYEQGY